MFEWSKGTCRKGHCNICILKTSNSVCDCSFFPRSSQHLVFVFLMGTIVTGEGTVSVCFIQAFI